MLWKAKLLLSSQSYSDPLARGRHGPLAAGRLVQKRKHFESLLLFHRLSVLTDKLVGFFNDLLVGPLLVKM